MLKFISVSLFCLLCLNSLAFGAETKAVADKNTKSNYAYDIDENFNFNDNSYNISDEQLEKSVDINAAEEHTSFLQKIINSSHFSAGTATKTYIPLNKSL